MQRVVPQEMIFTLDPAKRGETKIMKDMGFDRKMQNKLDWTLIFV